MDLVPLEKLSRMLRKKRQRTGVKQKKLADVAGMSPSHVNRIENSTTNPSYSSVYKLWKTLDELEKREIEHAGDLMNTPVDTVPKDVTLQQAAEKMRENSFSQLPVTEDHEAVGRITETRIIESGDPDLKVEQVMGSELMEVQEETPVRVVREILKDEPAVLVKAEGGSNGIITKADLL